ncbi:MAG: hypothetical protein U9N47_06135 [Thermodesulfobacteriota bacterium]|nr:hypothetical protein [Thermodesulfobacteriota bacterium]
MTLYIYGDPESIKGGIEAAANTLEKEAGKASGKRKITQKVFLLEGASDASVTIACDIEDNGPGITGGINTAASGHSYQDIWDYVAPFCEDVIIQTQCQSEADVRGYQFASKPHQVKFSPDEVNSFQDKHGTRIRFVFFQVRGETND